MKVGRIVRKLRIDDNCIVVVKNETPLAEAVDELVAAIHASGVKGVVVVTVNDFDDVKTLKEEDMNQVGWYKVETLANRILRAKNNDQERENGK